MNKNANLNLKFIESLKNYLVENREMIEPLFDMTNYVSFENEYQNFPIGFKLTKELGWCGCIIGWGFNLCEKPEDYLRTNELDTFIYYNKWAEDNMFLSPRELLTSMDFNFHQFISSSLWAKNHPSFEFAIERLDMLLSGYIPEGLYIELEKWKVKEEIEN